MVIILYLLNSYIFFEIIVTLHNNHNVLVAYMQKSISMPFFINDEQVIKILGKIRIAYLLGRFFKFFN